VTEPQTYARERIAMLPVYEPGSITMYGEPIDELGLGRDELLKIIRFWAEHSETMRRITSERIERERRLGE
jgi:hypothetical protein